ncbi:lactonase family protein [Streptomyces niveiscabiei]|uniref:Lactonase family protein n=1 Tax=Streptomyces niveiscabiei TaxID=164115 RepID=A0ABW9HYH1_9ACTN
MVGGGSGGEDVRCGMGGGWSRRRFAGVLGAVVGGGAVGCAGEGQEAVAESAVRDSGAGAAGGSGVGGVPSGVPSSGGGGPRPLYVGTYTSQEGGGEGIRFASYQPVTGEIAFGRTVTGVPDPSFLAVHPDGRTLYAVNEQERGAVTAVRISDGQVLRSLGTGGRHPCHLSVHPSGKWLLSADYGSGSVAVHPIGSGGELGERTQSVTHDSPAPGPGQQGPHAHQIVTTPDGRHVLAVDLGTDTVYTYRLDATAGTLTEVSRAQTRSGAGPRHLVFHPGGRYAYLANELDDTIAVCAYDAESGRLTIGEPQSTGSKTRPTYPSQPVVTPDGAYVYLANRGDNTLARYGVEADGARLRLLGTVEVGGDFPRHVSLSPDGTLLFASNQRSDAITVFHVNPTTGTLTPTGTPYASPMPVCALPL